MPNHKKGGRPKGSVNPDSKRQKILDKYKKAKIFYAPGELDKVGASNLAPLPVTEEEETNAPTLHLRFITHIDPLPIIFDNFFYFEKFIDFLQYGFEQCKYCSEHMDRVDIGHEWRQKNMFPLEDEHHHAHISHVLRIGRTHQTIENEFKYHFIEKHGFTPAEFTVADERYEEYSFQYIYKDKRFYQPRQIIYDTKFDEKWLAAELNAFVPAKCWQKRHQHKHYCKPPTLGIKTSRQEFAFDLLCRYFQKESLVYENEELYGIKKREIPELIQYDDFKDWLYTYNTIIKYIPIMEDELMEVFQYRKKDLAMFRLNLKYEI